MKDDAVSGAAPQSNMKSYVLAVNDTEFLLRDELRATRFALEYEKPELALRDAGIRSTVIVFGSARIPSPEQGEAMLRQAKGKDAIKRAKQRAALSPWYTEARKLGRIVSERGGALDGSEAVRDNVIATGGGPGIMEAANRGAMEAGAPSIGFNIQLPHEQTPNPYTTPGLTFLFHYFNMRKMHLVMRANALAVFPGGFGTMDEMFELLTLEQTKKSRTMPVVLVGKAYWSKVINFKAIADFGMIEKADIDLFDMVDTAEEAWDCMQRRGLAAHSQQGTGA
jgi:uncharacterized protein (TIGR00730 family)